MEIINPNEIGSKISTLILNASSFLYIVTPYVDISQWKKIIVNLERAKQKKVDIRFYIREIKDKDLQVLDKLSISVWANKHLHTKLYLNEKEAIVTSMNLYEYSDIHSKDIALYYDSGAEHEKLLTYFSTYIVKGEFDLLLDKSLQPGSTTASFSNESSLHKLHTDLCDVFPQDKITITDDYLYFTKAISGLDAFIKPNEICFKYTLARAKTSMETLGYYMKIRSALPDLHIEENRPGYWSINLINVSAQSIKKIIDKLRKDNQWVESFRGK